MIPMSACSFIRRSSLTPPRRPGGVPCAKRAVYPMNVLLPLDARTRSNTRPPVAIRMPNGALASLAGNVDPHHRVAIADLVLAQERGRRPWIGWSGSHQPDVVGLSVDDLPAPRPPSGSSRGCRRFVPTARIVAGGYDPEPGGGSVDVEPAPGVDFVVPRRGRGDLQRARCVRSRAAGALDGIARALVRHRTRRLPSHNPDRPIRPLEDDSLRLPNRDARACSPATPCSAGRWTSIETSRGCTFDCSFCSIIEMRGRNFHTCATSSACSPTSRDARDHGARAHLHGRRQHHARTSRGSRRCASAIVDAGLNDIDYIVQAMTSVDRGPRRRRWRRSMRRGRLPLRVPRHRERPRRRPRRS